MLFCNTRCCEVTTRAGGDLFCYHGFMFEQHLPHYIHTFENDSRWRTRTSDHYIFHYFENSAAEKDIDHIIERQEKAYAKIMSFLSVPEPRRPIEYFFYPDEDTKKELMGDDWYAQSIYNEFRVHVLYTEKNKPLGEHEDTHLLSLPWGQSIAFFAEGLAEYMVGHAWDGTPHLQYVREGYEKKLYPTLESFMRHDAWLETDDTYAIYFYSLAGVFTSFLISRFGKEKFEMVYTQLNRKNTKEENSTVCESVLGTSILSLETVFKDSLKNV